jgi:hypothetical protein
MSDDKKDPAGGVVEGLVKVLLALVPGLPPIVTGVLAILVAGGLLELGLAFANAASVVVVVVGVLVLAALVCAVVLLYGYQPPTPPAPAPTPPPAAAGDTRALADKLSPRQKLAACLAVASAVDDATDVLGAKPKKLRGNVWGCDGAGMLHILTDFDCNMTYLDERVLTWPVGQGNTGRAWQTGQPSIAIRRKEPGAEWGDAAVPADQQSLLHPDLSWVVSVPVFAHAAAGAAPTWVLSVDGVKDRRTAKDLQKVVGSMVAWAYQLGLLVGGVAP